MSPRIICLLIGYAFGLIQTSYIYGKYHHVDIRKEGSGNAGTTNAIRTFGSKIGIMVFAVDCLKCIAAVGISHLIFKDSYPEIIKLLGIYAGFGCILGHNFPVYMRFKGGKGIACMAGLIISFSWQLVIVGAIAFFPVVIITKYVSLSSLLLSLSFFIGSIVMGQMGCFGMAQSALTEMYIIIGLITAIAFYGHRANIVRLINGNERKTHLFKSKSNK